MTRSNLEMFCFGGRKTEKSSEKTPRAGTRTEPQTQLASSGRIRARVCIAGRWALSHALPHHGCCSILASLTHWTSRRLYPGNFYPGNFTGQVCSIFPNSKAHEKRYIYFKNGNLNVEVGRKTEAHTLGENIFSKRIRIKILTNILSFTWISSQDVIQDSKQQKVLEEVLKKPNLSPPIHLVPIATWT